MNFNGWANGPKIQVELKYCERCGGLGLRPRGASEVDCVHCRARIAGLSQPAGAAVGKPRLPRPKREDVQGQAQIEYLQAAIELEVRP